MQVSVLRQLHYISQVFRGIDFQDAVESKI